MGAVSEELYARWGEAGGVDMDSLADCLEGFGSPWPAVARSGVGWMFVAGYLINCEYLDLI